MNIESNYHVNIICNGFQLVECRHKITGQDALNTLRNIETIVKNHLPYIPFSAGDPFTGLCEQEQYLQLKKIAQDISKNVSLQLEAEKVKSCLSIDTSVKFEHFCPIYLIYDNNLFINIFKFLNENDLAAVSGISKVFSLLFLENYLWEKIYLRYFPANQNETTALNPPGYLKNKLRDYFNNMREGRYIEKVIPYEQISRCENAIKASLMNHGISQGKEIINLIQQEVNQSPRHLLMFDEIGNLFANAHQNTVHLQELSSDKHHCDITFPSNIAYLFKGYDRIFVETENQLLYVIGRKIQGEFDLSPNIVAPFTTQAVFLAAWNEWAVIEDKKQISLLKRDNDDRYYEYQFLEIKDLPMQSKLLFFRSLDGYEFMIQDALYSKNHCVICWRHDPQKLKWEQFHVFTEAQLLSLNNEYVFIGEYPGRMKPESSKSRFYQYTRSISVWKLTKQNYIETYSFKDAINLFVETHSIKPSDPFSAYIESWWNSYTYSSIKNYLFATRSDGDLLFFHGKPSSPQIVVIAKGSQADLKINKPNLLKTTKDFPVEDKSARHLGFTLDKSLVSMDNLRGVVIRQFDVPKHEVLNQIQEELQKSPTHFSSEKELVNYFHLQNRYLRHEQLNSNKNKD